MKVNPIPEGFTTVTPSLIVNGADKAIKLYTQAFGAKELYRMEMPDGSGKIMHSCILLGNSKVFITDVTPGMCATPSVSSFYLYFPDVNATFSQATKAGLQEKMPPQDMFWGDRMGVVTDPFGISWTIASHVREVSPEEMKEGAKKMMKAA